MEHHGFKKRDRSRDIRKGKNQGNSADPWKIEIPVVFIDYNVIEKKKKSLHAYLQ